MRWLADMYGPMYGDPDGSSRHEGGTRTTDQMHMAPARPSWPIYALPTPFYFQNAYNVNTTSVWKETNSGAGTGLTVQDERGGVAKFTNNAANDSYYFYESLYEIARLSDDKRCIFRGRFKIADVDQADVFFGLCSRLAAGNLFDNRVDAIGFYLAAGSASLAAEARKDSTATAETGIVTVSDDTWVYVHLNVDGIDRVSLFVTIGIQTTVKTISTNLPDDEEMCFAFGCRNGQAEANAMSVGFSFVLQDE